MKRATRLITADFVYSTVTPPPLPFGYTKGTTSMRFWQNIRLDRPPECIPVGNGRRFYSPSMIRFLQPDSYSPFKTSEINAYCYCKNDPVNRCDPSGHFSWLQRLYRIFSSQTNHATSTYAAHAEEIINPPRLDSLLSQIDLSKLPVDSPLPTRIIKNLQADDYANELYELQHGSGILTLRSSSDLKALAAEKSYKFTYSAHLQFNVLTPDTSEASHAATAGFSHNTEVISAGYIRHTQTGTWVLNNHSGHYRPDIKTLIWPAAHLHRLNAGKIRVSAY
jgi:RHS repeat-associated protein